MFLILTRNLERRRVAVPPEVEAGGDAAMSRWAATLSADEWQAAEVVSPYWPNNPPDVAPVAAVVSDANTNAAPVATEE